MHAVHYSENYSLSENIGPLRPFIKDLRTSSFLLSTFRIVTVVRNVGYSNAEDNKKKAKGLKKFSNFTLRMNVDIQSRIRFFCVKNCFIRPSFWHRFITAFSCKKFKEIKLETISFREGDPSIHFMFYRGHGHGNQCCTVGVS